MAAVAEEKMRDLFKDFDIAMLVTRTKEGELRSRPMACADVEEDGTFWFFTERRCGKTEEIEHDDHVNVAMRVNQKYASISGTARAVVDRAKIDELWREDWKTWFPKGKDDPNLTLLRVDGRHGEYWDNSGTSGIRYLIDAGRAYLTGDKPDVVNDPDIHGKVELK